MKNYNDSMQNIWGISKLNDKRWRGKELKKKKRKNVHEETT